MFLTTCGLRRNDIFLFFSWSLLLAFRCAGVASKIAKTAESIGGSSKFACALFSQGTKSEDDAHRKWAQIGPTMR